MTMRVVDGFWWRLRTTRYGIGRGAIEEVKGYVWVRQRQLGVDGGGGGGRQRRGSGGWVVIFLGWVMMCLWALRSGGYVYRSSFFVEYFDCKEC
jgi:hypothetical protein